MARPLYQHLSRSGDNPTRHPGLRAGSDWL